MALGMSGKFRFEKISAFYGIRITTAVFKTALLFSLP
jgi:hypothetical protein